MKNKSIDSALLSIEVSLENANQNTVLKAPLANFGYNEEEIQKGLVLLEEAKEKHALQNKEYGEQYDATDKLTTQKAKTNNTWMTHVKVARIAFKNDRNAQEALYLQGRRKQTYSGWIEQAGMFYKNALRSEPFKARLAAFGTTQEKLEATLLEVEKVSELLVSQLKEKGEAQKATEVRDHAVEELLDWYADFSQIARIALEDDPQMLEMLGIIQPSE